MSSRLVLITGGTGFVGSVLVPLVAQRYRVRTYDTEAFGNAVADTPNVECVRGDIRDLAALERAMVGVTDVIALAGVVTDELVDLGPAVSQAVNEAGTENVVHAALGAGVSRILYASSSSVYGEQGKVGVATEETEPRPQTAYAAQKLAGERILRDACQGRGVTWCAVRSATCAGPAPRMRLDTIVNVFSKQAYFDGRITVFGGDQWRTNLHVADAADLYLTLLDAPAEKIHGRHFNAWASCDTARDLAYLVADEAERMLGFRPVVNIDATRPDNRHYRMGGTALRDMLGWTPRHTLRDAIRDNFAWFREGHVLDPTDPIYRNTARMKDFVQGAA